MNYKIIIAFLLNTITSIACDCKSKTIKEEYNNSSLIIKGRVIKTQLKFHILTKSEVDSLEKITESKIFNDTIYFYEYTFRALNSIKSTKNYDTIVIRSGAKKSNCDIHFKDNTTYLLYGSGASEYESFLYPKSSQYAAFYSSICTRTTENWKREMKMLKKLKKSITETSHSEKPKS